MRTTKRECERESRKKARKMAPKMARRRRKLPVHYSTRERSHVGGVKPHMR